MLILVNKLSTNGQIKHMNFFLYIIRPWAERGNQKVLNFYWHRLWTALDWLCQKYKIRIVSCYISLFIQKTVGIIWLGKLEKQCGWRQTPVKVIKNCTVVYLISSAELKLVRLSIKSHFENENIHLFHFDYHWCASYCKYIYRQIWFKTCFSFSKI